MTQTAVFALLQLVFSDNGQKTPVMTKLSPLGDEWAVGEMGSRIRGQGSQGQCREKGAIESLVVRQRGV